jgi:hypothetical protein
MQLDLHPAPGVGELMPGWFAVPQNPLRPGSRLLTNHIRAALVDERSKARYAPRIGELVEASFTVPQNPLLDRLLAPASGCGCSPSGARAGMGALPDTVLGVPTNYLLIGAGALILVSLTARGGGYRRAVGVERERHRAEIARIRSEHPRVASRIRRAAGAAKGAF